MGRLVGIVLRKDDITKLYTAPDNDTRLALMRELMPEGWPDTTPIGFGLTIKGVVFMKTGAMPSQTACNQ